MIKLNILKILAGGPAGGVMLASLRVEVGIRTGRRPGESDFRDAVSELVNAGLCSRGIAAITEDDTLALTGAGRKAASKL